MDLTALLIEALQLALWLALPVLGACVLVAVLTSVMQASLQAGDPSLGFVPKWFAALAAVWLSRDFVRDRLLGFASHVLRAMSELGH